jgi:hypothetical protein
MFFGRHQLGDEIMIQVVCLDASDVPVMPTSAPSMDVWLGSTLVYSGLLMFPTERAIVTGLFMRPLRLANISLGTYSCVIRWQTGSFDGVALASFQVVAGGDSDGNCIAMTHFTTPTGKFLVRQLDSGKIRQGKNPT